MSEGDLFYNVSYLAAKALFGLKIFFKRLIIIDSVS